MGTTSIMDLPWGTSSTSMIKRPGLKSLPFSGGYTATTFANATPYKANPEDAAFHNGARPSNAFTTANNVGVNKPVVQAPIAEAKPAPAIAEVDTFASSTPAVDKYGTPSFMTRDSEGNQYFGDDSHKNAAKSTSFFEGSKEFDKTPTKQEPGMLAGLGSYLGFTGWGDGHSNGDIYKSDDGKYMKSGWFTDSEVNNPNQASSFDEYHKMGGTGTLEQYNDAHFKQGYLDNQSFMNNANLGLAGLQFGAGLYSTFGPNGSMDMNKKNMQVMDTQIENNRDIIDNRKKRATNITKYFGDGVRY